MQNKKAFAYNFLFMFISPTLSLVHGLKGRFGPEFKRRLLIVFITIYGSIITISGNNDGVGHLQNVYDHYTNLQFTQFLSELGNILLFRINPGTNQDPYIHVLSYLTGTLIGLPGLFFVFASFVYAYFFAGSIVKLFYFTRKKIKYSWLFYGIALVFILWKNVGGINSVRSWTGLWVLFYACLSYYQTKKIKYIFLMFVPPLVHVGYFVMAIPAWIVLMAGVRRKLYMVIFGLSFVATFINPQSALNELNKTEVGANKVRGYSVEQQATDSEILEGTSSNTWYLRLSALGVQKWAVNIMAFALIIFLVNRDGMTSVESRLFSIGLLTIALANSTWFLTALGGRSQIVGGLFILASVVLLWKRGYFNQVLSSRKKYLKLAMLISVLLFIPFIIYKLAAMIYLMSVYILAFPFIPWFWDNMNYSIREVISFFL